MTQDLQDMESDIDWEAERFLASQDNTDEEIERLDSILEILGTSKTGEKILDFVNYTLAIKNKTVTVFMDSTTCKTPRAYFSPEADFNNGHKVGLNCTYSNEYLACALAHELVHLIQYEYLDYMKKSVNLLNMDLATKERCYAYAIWPELAAYKMTRIIALEINLKEEELQTIEYGQDLIDMLNYRYKLQYMK